MHLFQYIEQKHYFTSKLTFLFGVTKVFVCMGGRETFLTARFGLVTEDLGVSGGLGFR